VSDSRQEARFFSQIGFVFFAIGVTGLTLALLDVLQILPPGIARWWLHSKAILLLLSLLALIVGCRLIWRSEHARTPWAPRTPGQRFHSLVLYTRKNCGLCDEASELLARYRDYLPPVVEADIDEDARLLEQFHTCVPVVQLDDKVRFRGRVSEVLLRRLIDGTPPVETGRARALRR
jgi:hypothetical protein